MAGKRQHHIPKLLLRGFSSKIHRGANFTWYFRKDSTPCEISINDLALSRKLYGDPGPDTLDDLITKEESRYALAIKRVRENYSIFEEDIPIISEFILNLICRTKYIRAGMLSATGTIIEIANSVLSKKESIEPVVERELKKHFPLAPAREFAKIKSQAMQELFPVAQVQSHNLFTLLRNNNTINISKAHNKAMLEILSKEEPVARKKRYSDLKWTVIRSDSIQFILGDIGVIEMDQRSGEFYPPIINKADDFVIFLPISNRAIVVGARSSQKVLPSGNIINKSIAMLSLEYFISANSSEIENELLAHLGEKASFWWQEIVANIKFDDFPGRKL